jgi:sugar transferase (PEP-CTERM/EpsH1 system associated)
MKILLLTPQLPYPPQKGTALRNWGLISGLAQRHEVSVLSFTDPGQCSEPAELLRQTCQVGVVEPPARTTGDRLRGVLASRQPDMALRLASEIYAQELARWLAQETYDVVHIEGIELAPYLEIIEAAQPRPLVVFDDHNCEYVLQQRAFLTDARIPTRWAVALYSLVQWLRLRRYEAKVCRTADRVLAVSEADAAALRTLVPGLEVAVIPNGIDAMTYQPVPTDQVDDGLHHLVFTGTMDFRPNVDAVLWFTRHVLPRLQLEDVDIHFDVVGQRPHARLKHLGAENGVTLTGWVEDVRPFIARADVYVAPLRIGGGTRLKLLEAMAMGKAVVATRLGAEGYPVTDGRELLLADTPTDFATAVMRLLRDPALVNELGHNARAFVERQYDWRTIVPQVEAVYVPVSA